MDRRLFTILALVLTLCGCAHKNQVTVKTQPAEVTLNAPGPALAPPMMAPDDSDLLAAEFDGNDRRASKISISPGSVEDYALTDLLTQLPKDYDMHHHHHPPVTKSRDSERFPEELHNVRVEGWIYAAKIEDDNDFHIILGSRKSSTNCKYLNCEVSGLPDVDSPDYPTLKNVRLQFFHIWGDQFPGDNYDPFPQSQRIHVIVEGSLFYDIDHPAGRVGPTGFRPTTAWEIHPVTKLTLVN